MIFSTQLLGIYTSSDIVIQSGIVRLRWIGALYIIAGLMEVSVGTLRGMGYSFLPMLVSIFGVCGLRLLWIAFVFPLFNTTDALYMIFPISWAITFVVHALCLAISYKRLIARQRLSA